jgi:glyoxylase-like metal-dependent hydrolase (beta-lactamase superfamily II)
MHDAIHRLELPPVDGLPEPLDHTTNVYLLDGPAPALVGAGHPDQHDALVSALAEHGSSPDDIERVVHPSWDIHTLGGAQLLPRADHFVWSPDLVQPRNYERVLEERRSRLRSMADAAVAVDERWDRAEFDAFLDRYLPRATTEFPVIPVRAGHVIRAGDLALEVVSAQGPHPGHCILLDRTENVAFTGDISMMGLPDLVDDVQAYLLAYERATRLDPELVMPTSGAPRKRGGWALRQAFRFVNNFLENAPLALGSSPTLLEFVERDLGHKPDSLVTWVFALLRYQSLLDELVRAHSIEVEGSGIDGKHYGIDVDDPRDERLRFGSGFD